MQCLWLFCAMHLKQPELFVSFPIIWAIVWKLEQIHNLKTACIDARYGFLRGTAALYLRWSSNGLLGLQAPKKTTYQGVCLARRAISVYNTPHVVNGREKRSLS
eukprot:6490243-Amphidinium_carterae.3